MKLPDDCVDLGNGYFLHPDGKVRPIEGVEEWYFDVDDFQEAVDDYDDDQNSDLTTLSKVLKQAANAYGNAPLPGKYIPISLSDAANTMFVKPKKRTNPFLDTSVKPVGWTWKDKP